MVVGNFNFLLEANGVVQAGFSEITGLQSETDVVEYRTGDEDPTVRKLRGLHKYGNVTLKRGVADGQDVFDWRKTVTDGATAPMDISIIVQDESRTEHIRYNLSNAWPLKWIGPELKANASEIAIETLEICYTGVTRG